MKGKLCSRELSRHSHLTMKEKLLPMMVSTLSAVVLLNLYAIANARRPLPYDTDQDWSSSLAALGKGGCQFAKKAEYRAPPKCPPPRRHISRENASRLGHRFAPIVFQHPLDSSWLTDPRHWFQEAVVYETSSWKPVKDITISNESGPSNYDFLTSQKTFASRLAVPTYNETDGKVDWEVVDGATLQRMAQIDPVVDGRLTGKVWYTVFRPHNVTTGDIFPHAYVYTYFLFYPWNGCSNQLLATLVDGSQQGIEYYMCGDGTHEGDLEHVKVYVCEDDMLDEDPSVAVQRMQLSQHGWLPELDCKTGQCNFEVDDQGIRRVVTYAGLFSHSNWAHETALYVYQKVRAKMLINMDGLYIGDRYMKGPVWYPNKDNTLFLPFLSEMTTEQQRGEFAWATFPGVWGATLKQVGKRTITCLVNGTRMEAPCPDRNPAYYILKKAIKPKSWRKEDLNYTGQTGGNTVTGPLWRREFALNWEMEREAPVYDGIRLNFMKLAYDGHCPFEDADTEDTETDVETYEGTSLEDYAMTLMGIILASTVVTLAMVMPVLLSRSDRKILMKLQDEFYPQEKPQPHVADDASGSASPSRSASAGGIAAPQRLLAELQEASPQEPRRTSAGSPAALTPPEPPPEGGLDPDNDCSLNMNEMKGGGPGEKTSGGGPTALSPLEVFQVMLLRLFQTTVLQPYLLLLWVFIGIVAYVVGVVLTSLGMQDVIKALNRVKRLDDWEVIREIFAIALVLFGVVQFAIVITSFSVRPMSYKICGCQAKRLRSARRSWRAHAVLAGLLVIEMNVTMVMFTIGVLLWSARYGLEQACNYALARVFSELGFVTDVCVDLQWVGIEREMCGADVVNMCTIWADLHVDYASFGAVLILLAQNMFLVLATTNYVSLRGEYAIKVAINISKQEEDPADQRSSSRWSLFRRLLRKRNSTLQPVLASTSTESRAGGPAGNPALTQV